MVRIFPDDAKIRISDPTSDVRHVVSTQLLARSIVAASMRGLTAKDAPAELITSMVVENLNRCTSLRISAAREVLSFREIISALSVILIILARLLLPVLPIIPL